MIFDLVNGTVEDVSIDALAERYETPLYVYSREAITRNVKSLRANLDPGYVDIHYACMANANPHILRLLAGLGVGCHVSSPAELEIALASGFTAKQIVATCSCLKPAEMRRFVDAGVRLNLDSLGQLRIYCEMAPESEVGLRVEPLQPPVREVRGGEAQRLVMRMGILEDQVDEALRLALQYKVRVVGLHRYAGTNIGNWQVLLQAHQWSFVLAARFPDLQYLDLGGGFGVDYSGRGNVFDWPQYSSGLHAAIQRLSTQVGRRVRVKLEPGRSILATSAILLASVVEVKQRGGYWLACVDVGLSSFIRPYLYREQHPVGLVGKNSDLRERASVHVTGATVATGDYLAWDKTLPTPAPGDLLAISDVGAYGFTMSSHFCGRLRPAEVMVDGQGDQLIRKREDVSSVLAACGVQGGAHVP